MIIELDIALEDSEALWATLAGMTDGTGIESHLVEEQGPGGGWPTVRFTGEQEELEAMLIEHGYEDGIDAYRVG